MLTKLARGKPTPAQIKRNEEKNERGVCRIQKRCGNNQGFETVGCGSLVKLQLSQSHWIKYAIITSNKVFQQAGYDVKKYRMDFKKSESKLETFILQDVISGSILQDPVSGLALIPLNPRSSAFCHGPLRRKCSVLKHSPFKVEFLLEDQRTGQNGLCCHMVADDPSSNSFGVKTHELTRDSSGQFTCNLSSFTLSARVTLGAAILRREENEWSLVGILNQAPSNSKVFLPVWLKSELFKFLTSVEDTEDGGDDGADDDSDDSDNDSDGGGGGEDSDSQEDNGLPIEITPQYQQNREESVDRVRMLLQEMGLTPFKQLRLHLHEALRAFLQCLTDMYDSVVEAVNTGSLKITVHCNTLEGLERLWNDYSSNKLNELAEKYLITDEIKRKLDVEEIKLKTEILEKDYLASKLSLRKIFDSGPTPLKEEYIPNIVLATNAEGWNTTVNGELVIELVKTPRVKVCGLVPSSTQEQRDQAKKSNIELVNAKELIYPPHSLYPPYSLDIDILIMDSFGRDSGREPLMIKETKKCKWVQVVHTISEELEKYMKKVSDPKGLAGHELQLALALYQEADTLIAIGPKVAGAYRYALSLIGKDKDVIDLTPEIVHDLVDIRPMCDDGDLFRVMIHAAYPAKYFKVKGCDVAAKAITLLQDMSYYLIFVVLPDDNAEDLITKLDKVISLSQFTVKHVSRNTEDWRKLLCEVDLAIMPSAEGFGTSCLRAISADLPVLSSGNSGFGMALNKLPSGGKHILDSEDPQVWADKIKDIRGKAPAKRALEARQLRREYVKKYSWKNQNVINLLIK